MGGKCLPLRVSLQWLDSEVQSLSPIWQSMKCNHYCLSLQLIHQYVSAFFIFSPPAFSCFSTLFPTLPLSHKVDRHRMTKAGTYSLCPGVDLKKSNHDVTDIKTSRFNSHEYYIKDLGIAFIFTQSASFSEAQKQLHDSLKGSFTATCLSTYFSTTN